MYPRPEGEGSGAAFLDRLSDDLAELLRVMENNAWHHHHLTTEEWIAYKTTVDLIGEVDDITERYPDSNRTTTERLDLK